MAFNINTQGDFHENPEGQIKIDGVLSPEEKRLLRDEVIPLGLEVLRDSTQGKLADFLHTDVLPNLENSDLDNRTQESLRTLAGLHPINQVEEHITLDSQILSYFSIDRENANEIQAMLEKFGAEGLNTLLMGYKDFIEKNLGGLDAETISKIQESIGIRVSRIGDNLNDVYKTARRQGNENNLEGYRWMVDAGISKSMDYIKNKILPSAQLLSEYRRDSEKVLSASRYFPTPEQDPYSMGGVNPEAERNRMISEMISQTERMFRLNIAKDGTFNAWGPDIFTQGKVLTLGGEVNNAIFEHIGGDISQLEGISVLSEADKKLESEVMLSYLLAIGVQCLPYVGIAAGGAVDFQDLFSSTDATLDSLKRLGLVPSEYQMDKGVLEHFLAAGGLVLSLVGLQSLARSKKLTTAMKGIKNLDAESTGRVFQNFSDKLGLSEDASRGLRALFGIGEEVPPSVSRGVESTLSDIIPQRSMRHTTESYTQAGGRPGELGFIDKEGRLHINSTEFEKLSPQERQVKMREFISHERAHQAIMNLPEGKLQEIHQRFLSNQVFSIIGSRESYNLRLDRTMNPLDTTNEILAHMIGRYRVGKQVPDSFLQSLRDVGVIQAHSVNRSDVLSDINRTFGINASRREWNQIGGVRNTERLSEAAMQAGNLDWVDSHALKQFSKYGDGKYTDLLRAIGGDGDLASTLTRIDFGSEEYKGLKAMLSNDNNFTYIPASGIKRLERYLQGQNKPLPQGLNRENINEGEIYLEGGFMKGLFELLEEMQVGEKIPTIRLRGRELFTRVGEIIDIDAREIRRHDSGLRQLKGRINEDTEKLLSQDEMLRIQGYDDIESGILNLFEGIGEEKFTRVLKEFVPQSGEQDIRRFIQETKRQITKNRETTNTITDSPRVSKTEPISGTTPTQTGPTRLDKATQTLQNPPNNLGDFARRLGLSDIEINMYIRNSSEFLEKITQRGLNVLGQSLQQRLRRGENIRIDGKDGIQYYFMGGENGQVFKLNPQFGNPDQIRSEFFRSHNFTRPTSTELGSAVNQLENIFLSLN